jgi:hypothetical protein
MLCPRKKNPKPPLSLGNVPFYLLGRWLGGPHHYSGHGDGGRSSELLCSGIKPRPVTLLTLLHTTIQVLEWTSRVIYA